MVLILLVFISILIDTLVKQQCKFGIVLIVSFMISIFLKSLICSLLPMVLEFYIFNFSIFWPIYKEIYAVGYMKSLENNSYLYGDLLWVIMHYYMILMCLKYLLLLTGITITYYIANPSHLESVIYKTLLVFLGTVSMDIYIFSDIVRFHSELYFGLN